MKSIVEVCAELDDQVVCEVLGIQVKRKALADAFNRVAPKENWKNPIKVEVRVDNDFDLLLIHKAIEFFTGSKSKAVALGRNRYRIEAAGYYLTCGA